MTYRGCFKASKSHSNLQYNQNWLFYESRPLFSQRPPTLAFSAPGWEDPGGERGGGTPLGFAPKCSPRPKNFDTRNPRVPRITVDHEDFHFCALPRCMSTGRINQWIPGAVRAPCVFYVFVANNKKKTRQHQKTSNKQRKPQKTTKNQKKQKNQKNQKKHSFSNYKWFLNLCVQNQT